MILNFYASTSNVLGLIKKYIDRIRSIISNIKHSNKLYNTVKSMTCSQIIEFKLMYIN